MAAIELYTPQGAEMVSGMIYEPYEPYEPYEQGVIMRLEHHLVGGYVRYISPHIIIIIYNLIDSWLAVVEETHMLKLGSMRKVSPPDEIAVKALQAVPPNWSLECDEELAKFLFEKTDQVDEMLGSNKQYINSVVVSSSAVRYIQWCLCPWARHFIVIASLHPNNIIGYLSG